MSIILKYNNSEYKIETILWDRDSFFVDFNGYWSRLVATMAQLVAENTTDNWNTFNVIRTQTIQLLGINSETQKAELSSPVNLMPVSYFHSLISSNLHNHLREKTLDNLNELFKTLVSKSLTECTKYIKDSINHKNLEILKKLNNGTEQILITNDCEENTNIFLKEAHLETQNIKCIAQTRKDQLEYLLRKDKIFITNNSYLKNIYTNIKPDNILLVEDLSLLTYNELKTREIITINIDGASKGNPGPASIGIAFSKGKEIIHEISEFLGNQTNNFAEYTALIRALEISLENDYHDIEIKSDSELVVKQINKTYKVKDAYIKELFDRASELIIKLKSFKIAHIPREENLRADKLANNALNIKQL